MACGSMKILFLLIPLSLALFGLAVWAFIWAVRSGQFDDLDSPGWRVLQDDDPEKPENSIQEHDL